MLNCSIIIVILPLVINGIFPLIIMVADIFEHVPCSIWAMCYIVTWLSLLILTIILWDKDHQFLHYINEKTKAHYLQLLGQTHLDAGLDSATDHVTKPMRLLPLSHYVLPLLLPTSGAKAHPFTSPKSKIGHQLPAVKCRLRFAVEGVEGVWSRKAPSQIRPQGSEATGTRASAHTGVWCGEGVHTECGSTVFTQNQRDLWHWSCTPMEAGSPGAHLCLQPRMQSGSSAAVLLLSLWHSSLLVPNTCLPMLLQPQW